MIDHIVIRPNPTLIVGDSFAVDDTDVSHMRGSGFLIDLLNDLPVWVECEREELESVIQFLSTNFAVLKVFDDLKRFQVMISETEFIVDAKFDTTVDLFHVGFHPVKSEASFDGITEIEISFYERENESFQIEHHFIFEMEMYAKFELRVKHEGFNA